MLLTQMFCVWSQYGVRPEQAVELLMPFGAVESQNSRVVQFGAHALPNGVLAQGLLTSITPGGKVEDFGARSSA